MSHEKEYCSSIFFIFSLFNFTYSQVFIGLGASYSIGNPSEISGYNYDYNYSGAYNAITEDIETVKGGFSKGFYGNIELGYIFNSGVILKGGYSRIIKSDSTILTTSFNYTGIDNVSYKLTVLPEIHTFSLLFGSEKRITKNDVIQLLVGPIFMKGKINEKFKGTNTFNKDNIEIDNVYLNKLDVGASIDLIYLYKVGKDFQISTKVNYQTLVFSPKNLETTSYRVNGLNKLGDLSESEKYIEFKKEATKKYDVESLDPLDEDEISQERNILFPISGFSFSLGLVYTINKSGRKRG